MKPFLLFLVGLLVAARAGAQTTRDHDVFGRYQQFAWNERDGLPQNEDLAPGGIVNVEGDHRIHVIDVFRNRVELDRRFDLDFDRDIPTGPARPHGVVMASSRND